MDGGKSLRDLRVSVCKRCREGIFKTHRYTWQIRPIPGYIHVDCDNK